MWHKIHCINQFKLYYLVFFKYIHKDMQPSLLSIEYFDHPK